MPGFYAEHGRVNVESALKHVITHANTTNSLWQTGMHCTPRSLSSELSSHVPDLVAVRALLSHSLRCGTDWDTHPIPHLNGTIPSLKRKDAFDGGGGKKRKKGGGASNGNMWEPPAVVSNNEQQARHTRAKRFEAHLQASNTNTNVR